MTSSKGKMEDEITKAMIQWEKEYKGKGPTDLWFSFPLQEY